MDNLSFEDFGLVVDRGTYEEHVLLPTNVDDALSDQLECSRAVPGDRTCYAFHSDSFVEQCLHILFLDMLQA